MASAIPALNMRRFNLFFWVAVLSFVLSARISAVEYHLTNGDIIDGDPASVTEDGVVFRLKIGGFSPKRIRWAKFTQESLVELSKDPKAKEFAEPFIDAPPESAQPEKKKREFVVRKVDSRLPHYEKVGFVEAWTTPGSLVMLFVLYAANLYAAYEIARFRGRPAGLICGVSAVFPVFAPLLFLSLPTLHEEHVDSAPAPEMAASAPPPPAAAPESAHRAQGGGLGLAKAVKEEGSGGGAMTPGVFKRGDFTLNRRFVETKFSGFFRVVPIEAERDLVLVIRTNKNEFVAKRVSRISANEMHVQLLHGAVEQQVPFADIVEFQIRHKDAKS
jgi:hypothetical protein